MEDKIWSVDLNDDETYYIVKFSGSMGIVYDMSNAAILTAKDMLERVEKYCDVHTACIKSVGYDERLNMYAFRLLADMEDYKQQHVAWIYSPKEDQPYWTLCPKECKTLHI